MFADYDGRARRHIYVVYVSLHDRHTRFAMPAMFGASAAEVWWLLLISSRDSGGPGDGTIASQAQVWGNYSLLTASAETFTESVGNNLNYSLWSYPTTNWYFYPTENPK